jgi:MoxR-like ATPase
MADMKAERPPLPETFLFRGDNIVDPNRITRLPKPPVWRQFTGAARAKRGSDYQADLPEIEMLNAALYLRRPLLVTGKPGSGKSSLAYAAAYELGLGEVLIWPITTQSTLLQALYNYDAIARLQDASLDQPRKSKIPNRDSRPGKVLDIGRYVRLGPLGTALLGGEALPEPDRDDPNAQDRIRRLPRVLLIDEIDKSDMDLPNNLLNVFEEGEFEIPELSRLPEEPNYEEIEVATHNAATKVKIRRGRVRCEEFPLVILTSNGEREFPPAFLRRCLRLQVSPPKGQQLKNIIQERMKPADKFSRDINILIEEFENLRDKQNKELATDQLLNAVFMVIKQIEPLQHQGLKAALLQSLTETLPSNAPTPS